MGMMDDPSQLREMCPYTTDDCKCLYCRTASEIETLRARVVELEKAIKEDHYPCPDGCVGGCEVCLAMQEGEE